MQRPVASAWFVWTWELFFRYQPCRLQILPHLSWTRLLSPAAALFEVQARSTFQIYTRCLSPSSLFSAHFRTGMTVQIGYIYRRQTHTSRRLRRVVTEPLVCREIEVSTSFGCNTEGLHENIHSMEFGLFVKLTTGLEFLFQSYDSRTQNHHTLSQTLSSTTKHS